MIFILIALDFYGDDESATFETTNIVNNFYRIELKSAIIDELFIDETTNNLFNFDREEWSYETVALAKFQGNLEAGNITNNDTPIEYIKFRKRKVDTLLWQDIAIFTFDVLQQIYEYTDRVVQATEEFEYMIIPITSSVTGSFVTSRIQCDFESTFLVDKSNSYQLLYNLEYSDIENVLPSTTIETYSKYPTVVYGQSEYSKSSIKTLIISDYSISGEIDKRQERLNRENMMRFLNNRKPKILKDGSGRYYLISILGGIRETPNNNLSQSISEINFNWVEIGDAQNETDLKNNGLID